MLRYLLFTATITTGTYLLLSIMLMKRFCCVHSSLQEVSTLLCCKMFTHGCVLNLQAILWYDHKVILFGEDTRYSIIASSLRSCDYLFPQATFSGLGELLWSLLLWKALCTGQVLAFLLPCDTSSPLSYSCLENSVDRGAWWAVVHGVAESDTAEWLTHTHTISLGLLGGARLLAFQCCFTVLE